MAKRKPKTAPVHIWSMNYERRKGIAHAVVTDLPTGQEWIADEAGYIRTEVEVGRTLTLVFNHSAKDTRYPPVQTSTVAVPKEGLTGENSEIAIQVPTKVLYTVLRKAVGDPQPGHHHIITTIQPHGKNMHEDEGVAGATGHLYKDGRLYQDGELYLGSFGERFFKTGGKTEWCRPIAAHNLSRFGTWLARKSSSRAGKALAASFTKAGRRLAHKSTSADGAVFFLNVPAGSYSLHARKPKTAFSTANIEIRPESPLFINATPPHSPHELPRMK